MCIFRKVRYAEGFKWGKREHRWESNTRLLLLVGTVLLLVYIFLGIPYLHYVACAVLILAVVFSWMALAAHRVEKAYMDKLRFKR